MKTKETLEEVSSHPGEKGHWRQKSIGTPPPPEKSGERTRKKDSKKDLQICGAGGKPRKRPTLFVGEKSNGKFRFKREPQISVGLHPIVKCHLLRQNVFIDKN
jgi:hypothetical protein